MQPTVPKSAKSPLELLSLRVENIHDAELTLWLEPWANEYRIAPADYRDIVFAGPPPATPHTQVKHDSILVWGWSGCVAYVFHDGKCLDVGCETIEQIIQSELELAQNPQVLHAAASLDHDVIELAQAKLEFEPSWDDVGREFACVAAAIASVELARSTRSLLVDRAGICFALMHNVIERVLEQRGAVVSADEVEWSAIVKLADDAVEPRGSNEHQIFNDRLVDKLIGLLLSHTATLTSALTKAQRGAAGQGDPARLCNDSVP